MSAQIFISNGVSLLSETLSTLTQLELTLVNYSNTLLGYSPVITIDPTVNTLYGPLFGGEEDIGLTIFRIFRISASDGFAVALGLLLGPDWFAGGFTQLAGYGSLRSMGGGLPFFSGQQKATAATATMMKHPPFWSKPLAVQTNKRAETLALFRLAKDDDKETSVCSSTNTNTSVRGQSNNSIKIITTPQIAKKK
jgi:hypothetical protein